ncbi:hypothetical protein H310_11851 [Aphanomyces invadans]|uniref:Uncharacterized protein n=1 Tax=Aphanomyces invadans TaxID=157072 RepID=A0A024TKL5_9STRA|nr:hypothetical protein H310_11851 [Aphanomyces invadans]ETV94583.1 hypothetical protein H310_11851 [Aphanomyces invadans]|eukprot:XP_008876898.1 hypothetical protein H310_11851 [Aphanomyces invadans]
MRRIATTVAALAAVVLSAAPFPEHTMVHIVFSTSCAQESRRLHSAALQLSAVRVGHQGPITEIISGCSDADAAVVRSQPTFYPDFHVHFTPSYEPTPVEGIYDPGYTPYNKPFGLRHFLQHATGGAAVKDNRPIALLDGDFLLLQPLQVNLGRNLSKYYIGDRTDAITDDVRDGVAIAQDWRAYLGSGWFAQDERKMREKSVLCQNQPCMNVTAAEALRYYTPTGPPYILTKHDAVAFVDDYCNFTVEGRKMYKDAWMVEMYAYGAAAANHGIKHTILTMAGVTGPVTVGEFWSFLDADLANPCKDPIDSVFPTEVPWTFHFCHSYGVNERTAEGVHFTKHKMPKDILNCDGMLLALPAHTVWDKAEMVADLTSDQVANELDALLEKKRHKVWAECTLIKELNHAIVQIKERTCPHGYNSHRDLVMRGNAGLSSALPSVPTA